VLGQQTDLGGLAAPLPAFETDETASAHRANVAGLRLYARALEVQEP
jgi:hypothetical protein